MPTKDFFNERTEASEVKTEIVRKYFWPWAKIISKQVRKRGDAKIGYVDLFAGSGRYEDGSKSTPILILEGAIRDDQIREMLVTLFNDQDPEKIKTLREEVSRIDGINLLKHAPFFMTAIVGEELAQKFEQRETIPSLFFLDPWGYKGLSLRLIKAVLRPWGCDCIFFFNYNRINAALSNPTFDNNMNNFFGKEPAEKLRQALKGKSPDQRERLIISDLKQALKELGGTYNIEYFFKDSSGHKTSHFLILTSKHPLAESIMKEIMAAESSRADHGIASFGFNPRDKDSEKNEQSTLFEMSNPLEDLGLALLQDFAGRTMRVREIFQQHHVGKHFVLKNYKEAINMLDSTGRIQTEPPAELRKRAGRVTLGDDVVVIFPPKEVHDGN